MSEATLYKYKIWCNTESAWVERWDTTPISTCPNNNAHEVNTNSVSITDEISKNLVTIQEETIPTGGNYMCYSIKFIAATGPDVVTTHTKIHPFPISALGIRFTTEAQHRGDEVKVCVAPNTIIGALAGVCPTGATGATVTQTVVDHIMVGYYVNFFDGVYSVDGNRVLTIDKNTNRITWETPLTRSFSFMSPTYIRMTVYVINSLLVGPAATYQIGGAKIGGSYVPAGTIVNTLYNNKSDYPKEVYAMIEIMY